MTAPKERRHDLDVLRVLCIVLLIFFHAAMPFMEEWDWFVKNDERSRLYLEFGFFVSRWRMALLFAISGMGTAYALRRRTDRQYLSERSHRLLVPVLFASVFLVPPQVVVERLQDGARYGSAWDFLRTYSDLRAYPDGNYSWHHLWFVAYLFCYSAMGLPLFRWLRSAPGILMHEQVEAWLLRKHNLHLLAIIPGLAYGSLIQEFHGPQDIFRDWAMFLVYLSIFVFGFLMGDRPRLWQHLEDRRGFSLAVASASLLFVNVLRWNKIEPPPGPYLHTFAYLALTGGMFWIWALAILGYGRRYLNRPVPALDYANQAAYPVYILHQPIIVVLGYFLVQQGWSLHVKFAILSLVSFAATILLYHWLFRPFRPMRYLVGLKD